MGLFECQYQLFGNYSVEGFRDLLLDSLQDVFNLYEGGIKGPSNLLLDKIKENIPQEMLKELVNSY